MFTRLKDLIDHMPINEREERETPPPAVWLRLL
jgi:hypothetical protein